MTGVRGDSTQFRAPPRRFRPAALVAATIALLAAACVRDEGGRRRLFDGPEDFYGLRALPTFHLALAPTARAALKKKPKEWVEAELRYGPMRWTVGLRLKGNRSLRKLDDKPSFKIKMNRIDKKARFFGLKELVFNNLVEDPTLVREILAYRLHREVGVPAPDAAYARVYLDGEYAGLYLFLEAIDDEFLERRFDDPDGELYEGEYGCDLYPDDVPGFQQEEGADGRTALAALAEAAGGPVAGLIGAEGARFDRAGLGYLAVSALIGDFDGYRHSHNYRIYRDPSRDRWFFVPWGLDRAFKQRLAIYDSAGLVARRCFADAACRVAYLRELERATAALERLNFDQAIAVLDRFLVAALADDTQKPYDADRTAKARAELLAFVKERPAEVRAQLSCLAGDREVDADGDGAGCLDCADDDPAVHPGAAEACDGRDDDCDGLVDEAAACPCPEVTLDGVRFAMCPHAVSWSEAAAMCAERGGALATLDSEAQSRALYDAARAIAEDRWWLGYDDRAEEGAWRRADGAAPAFTHWVKGEPDNDACNQDCAALQDGADGRWHDTHCGQREPFVCRF